jgi:hypothetical protein
MFSISKHCWLTFAEQNSKTMKKHFYLKALISCMLLYASLSAQAQGPKNALRFNGAQSIQSVSVSHGIGSGEFTWEAWVKPAALSGSTCVMTNANYSPSFYASTKGTSGDGSVGVYWSGWKNSGSFLKTDKWAHIAVVRRVDTLFFYVNGILAPNKHTIKGLAMANGIFRLGWSGDAGEYYSGDMDEVRVWNIARTADDIHSTMCRKLSGTEAGLKQYYRMDEGADTVTADATASAYPLKKVAPEAWVASGAAIGDTSVCSYPGSWSGVSLKLATTGKGAVSLDSFAGTGSFVHLYRINSVPSLTKSLTDYKDNDVYYGVFASDTPLRVYAKYEYGAYATAVANKSTIRFFLRNYNSDSSWALKSVVYNNTVSNTMRVDSMQGSRQLFLANFVSTCSVPSALTTAAISPAGAQLGWTSGGAGLWNIQYGLPGFTPGTGTSIKAVNTNPYLLNGLVSGTAYEFYVQDSCTGLGSSAWAGPYAFKTLINPARLGAGTGLTFNGAESIVTDSVVRHNIGRKEFTYEAWVKPTKVTGATGFISNGSFAPCFYATTAGVGGDGSVGYYVSGSWKNSGTFLSANKWYHLAMVRSNDTITVYVNGVAAPNRYPSKDSILNQKLTLGWSRDASEYFKGDIDEVRIWNVARTQSDLRNFMCSRLAGTETGLVNYYRLDEGSGTKANDLANGRNFSAVTPSRWMVSGAAIGDSSVHQYTDDWKGKSVQMKSSARGNLLVDSVANSPKGIHIYRVDSIANTVNGITTPAVDGGYYGVFVAEGTEDVHQWAHYDLAYDYSNYTTARTNEAAIRLYNRSKNADTLWTDFWSVKNTTSHTLKAKDVMLRREAIIGELTALACAAPQSLHADTIKATYARIGFSGSPANWNVAYGPSGFAPGTGKLYSATTLNPALADTLNGATLYDVYIQQNCGSTKSKWSGPYSFVTKDLCPDPSGLKAVYLGDDSARISWTSGGSAAWNLEYGLKGYIPGSGVPVPGITSLPYVITGLFASTSYDFYIQDTCIAEGKASRWVGPVTVTTKPSCYAPTAFTGTYLGADSARLSWKSGGAAQWNIEYGPAGFVISSGTFLPSVSSSFYRINGLTVSSTYDFYVQDTCEPVLSASRWIGPVQIRTSATGFKEQIPLVLRLFPNPAKNVIHLHLNRAFEEYTVVRVFSMEGALVREISVRDNAASNELSIATRDLAPGLYLVRINTDKEQLIARFSIME